MAQWAPNISTGSGPSGPVPTAFVTQNRDVSPILNGMAVTQHPSGTGVLLAIATSVDTAAIGLATQDIPVGDSGSISVDAIVVVADWTLVTAEAAPTLAPRGIYFLSDSTPGILTLTPPSAPGSVVQMVARSLDPNAVDLILDQPILL